MKLSDLHPAPYNPRTITPEAMVGLRTSMGEFGDLSGLTWNKRTGHLVCGHQRLVVLQAQHGEALTMNGAGVIKTPDGREFPVRVVDWDEDREKLANIAANNPHIAGTFTADLDKIVAELKAGDLSELVAPLRIEELIGEIEPAPGLTDGDEVPAVEEQPVTRTGDLWLCGDHRVLCGDSTKAADVERVLGGEKAELGGTDPPYGIDHPCDYKSRGRGGIARCNDYPAVVGDGQPFDPSLILGLGLPTILWGANHYADKLPPSSGWLVWDKERPDDLDQATCELAWTNCVKGVRRLRHLWHGCMRVSEHGENYHATQKPVALVAWSLSLRWTTDYQQVFDPFLGSGTTLIAAEQLGRRCFGIEIEPRYCDVIVRRWQKFTGRSATLDGDGRAFDDLAAERVPQEVTNG